MTSALYIAFHIGTFLTKLHNEHRYIISHLNALSRVTGNVNVLVLCIVNAIGNTV